MSANGVGRSTTGLRFSRIRSTAWALPLAALLLAALPGCGLLETPEPTPTIVPTQPAATVPPTPTPETVRPPTPSEDGLALQIAVAAVPGDLPEYDRDEWRHWTDEDGDCQNARQEVLIAESAIAVEFSTGEQCRVSSGRWRGPYTGEVVDDPTELDIDHMVPLENAHRSGAWAWDRQRKREFANSMGYDNHLIAAISSANRSKGSKGPERWRPPLESYWCVYAIDWVTIKNNWDLTVTEAEYAALREMLATCPMPALLQRKGVSQPPSATPVPTPVPVATPTPTPRPTVPPGLRYDPFGPDRDCSDFDTYQEALDFYLAAGGPASDPHNLDSDGDGQPCSSLPRSKFQGQSVRLVPAQGFGFSVPVSLNPSSIQPPAALVLTATPVPSPPPTPAPLPTSTPVPALTATPESVSVPEPTLTSSPSPTSILTLAPTQAPTPEPMPTPTIQPLTTPGFSELLYDPRGSDRSCGDFASWWEAQNFFYAAGGPYSDPHRLDGNADGIACQSLPGAPDDDPGRPAPASETSPEDGFADRNCGDFDTWQEAQDFFLSGGGPEEDPNRLDQDGDGVACQALPGAPEDDLGTFSLTDEMPPQRDDGFSDRNCGDFAAWQEAQDFFLSEGGQEDDPHRLDRNDNGIACESLPGAP